jgi:hypothetical protein
MHFETQSNWEVTNPLYKIFDNPEMQCFRWRAVDIPLAIYYYHIHLVPKKTDVGVHRTELLLGDIVDVLVVLQDFPSSSVYLNIPCWRNGGEQGLYRVVAFYQTDDSDNKFYIAECGNGKKHILAFDTASESIDVDKVEKTIIWSEIQKKGKRKKA